MSFDRMAGHYRWLEILFAGSTLQQCRTALLQDELLNGCRRVLIVGEGDGRFLQECAAQLPEAEFLCVDGSEVMLSEARRRNEGNGRIRFLRAEMPDWQPPAETFDLIVTHFFLDCFGAGDLENVIGLLSRAGLADAVWLLADFQIPKGPMAARLRAKLVIAAAYAFFRMVTGLRVRRLVDPAPFLESHGFHRVRQRIWSWEMLYSSLWMRSPLNHR